MKPIVYAAVLAAVLSAPIASFAQSAAPVTRAQVRAELAQLEKAGYNPAADNVTYPANLQSAEQRVAAQNAQVAESDTSGYGSHVGGGTQSGGPVGGDGPMSVYFGR